MIERETKLIRITRLAIGNVTFGYPRGFTCLFIRFYSFFENLDILLATFELSICYPSIKDLQDLFLSLTDQVS